jgi:hypothetical protein
MSSDSRVTDLLTRWRDSRAGGNPVTPEELCGDCPELLADLRQHIEALVAVDAKLDATTRVDDSSQRESNAPMSFGNVPLCSAGVPQLGSRQAGAGGFI